MLPFWQGGLIVLLVFLAYLPALHGGFVWDDDTHISTNETLRSWQGLREIWFLAPDEIQAKILQRLAKAEAAAWHKHQHSSEGEH